MSNSVLAGLLAICVLILIMWYVWMLANSISQMFESFGAILGSIL